MNLQFLIGNLSIKLKVDYFMDSSGFEPEASSMPRRRSSADLRALEYEET